MRAARMLESSPWAAWARAAASRASAARAAARESARRWAAAIESARACALVLLATGAGVGAGATGCRRQAVIPTDAAARTTRTVVRLVMRISVKRGMVGCRWNLIRRPGGET